MLLRGEDRGLRLVEVGHGLDDDEIRAAAGFDGLGENIVGLLKRQCPGGLEKGPDRADVERDEGVRAAGGPAGIFDRGGDELGDRAACAGHLPAVRPERVRVDDLAPVFNVPAVHVLDPFGLFDVERLGNRAESHALGLQHGAHGAVEEDVVIFEKRSDIHLNLLRENRWCCSA